jgi:hypothetical protein
MRICIFKKSGENIEIILNFKHICKNMLLCLEYAITTKTPRNMHLHMRICILKNPGPSYDLVRSIWKSINLGAEVTEGKETVTCQVWFILSSDTLWEPQKYKIFAIYKSREQDSLWHTVVIYGLSKEKKILTIFFESPTIYIKASQNRGRIMQDKMY